MPTSSYNKFNCFVADINNKVHNLGSDTLEVALTNTLPVATQTSVASEITYTNLSARDITTTSSTQTGGTYKLILVNLTLTSSIGDVAPFRYIVIRNKTANKLICWFDYGSSLTLHGANGDILNLVFDGTDGLFTIV
jgi:hypothetical protein